MIVNANKVLTFFFKSSVVINIIIAKPIIAV